MTYLIRLALALLFWFLAWLAPKPCMAGSTPSVQTPAAELELRRRYQGLATPRLHVKGRWVYLDGIVEAIDTKLPRMHACTVRYPGGTPTGFIDEPITLVLNRDGMVIRLTSSLSLPEGVDDPMEMRDRWRCLERTLKSVHFPPSRGRTILTLTYHSFMPSVNSMPGTPTELYLNASN